MISTSMQWLWVRTTARRTHRSDQGAGLVEYAMLMGLVVLVCITAVTFFGESTSSKMSIQADCFEGMCDGTP